MTILLKILLAIFLLFQLLLASYLLIPISFLLIYLLMKLFRIKTPFERKKIITDKNFDFGLIITAHEDTRFILPLVDSILKQSYPNFQAYIVADACDISTLQFSDPRVTVLRPETPLNAKVRSIQYAISRFVRKHDNIIIFDADNLIHGHFLEIINRHFQKGYKVVQSNFKPKNIDTNYARMDAIGDIFNFFLEREMRMRMNISASVWGSGVAIDYELYSSIEYPDLLGGFDKRLQSHLVQNTDKIGYAPDALLFDEKISSGKSLENQRTRWINAYFKYFNESWFLVSRGILKGNFDMFYSGYIMLRLPLFITLAAGFLVTFINYFISLPLFYTWLGIMLSFFIAFAGIVAVIGKDFRYIRTMFSLPLFVFNQVMALTKIKKAKKSFLKTRHTRVVYIDELTN